MTTTLQNLIDDARVLTRDTAQPYLWSDADWTVYANQAQTDACRRAHLITDTLTDTDGTNALCLYTLAPAAKTITLHGSIIHVRNVVLISTGLPLPEARREDIGALFPQWESAADDVPIVWCQNYQKGKLRFYPGSAAADSVRMTVIRAPMKPMALASPGPQVNLEIDDVYREGMVLGMLARAYRKPGEETMNPQQAASYEALFTREFGEPRSALVEQWQRDHAYADETGAF
jgi:hypothetical protein